MRTSALRACGPGQQQFKEGLDIPPAPDDNPVADLLRRARSCLGQGDYNQAEALADEARRIAPSWPDPVILLAEIAGRRGSTDDKIAVLRQHIGSVRNDVRLRRAIAETFLNAGQTKPARAEIEGIIDRGAARFEDYLLCARCWLAEEQYEKAEHFANLARHLEPGRPEPVLLLARIAVHRSDFHKQIEILEGYRASGDGDIRIARQLANAHVKIGDYQTAKSYLESIAARGAEIFADSLTLGEISLDEGDYQKASGFAERARTMAPDKPGPVLQLARIAEARGDHEAVVSILGDAIAKGIADFHVRVHLATVHIGAGKPDDAVAALEPLDLRKTSDPQLFDLSGMYEMCGRADLAMACYRQIDPDGAFGTAVLLADVLAGTTGCAKALASHERRGLAKDNFYQALLAYAEKQGLGGGNRDGDALLPEAVRGLGQYFGASGYFDPERAFGGAAAPLVSIVAPIHRAEDEANLVAQLLRQDYPALEAIVVINGPGLDHEKIRQTLETSGRFRRVHVEVLPDSASLSMALNAGLSLSRGEYIARFDADDIYMDRFIARTIGFMQAESAGLCGKPHVIVHFEKLGCNVVIAVYNGEYNPVATDQQSHGSGSTIVMSRAVAETIRFDESLKSSEDVDFYLRSRAAGFRIVFAPPFDHVVLRREDKSAHTWQLTDLGLLENSPHGYFLSRGSCAEVERQTEQFLKDADIPGPRR